MEQRFVPATHRWALWWGGPLMTVLYLIGWVVVGHMIPVPSSDYTAAELSGWLVDHKPNMVWGCMLMIAATGLWGSWAAAITVWTYRTEANFPVLTFTQLICVAAGVTFFVFDTLLWGVATYRAGEVDPEITQQLWDLGWFGFLFTITVYITWALAWGMGILLNPAEYQVFPRWAAWITFGSVMCWSPGLLIIFFKGGPFSYSGQLAMWLPITEFFVWLAFIDILARKAVSRQVLLSRIEGIEQGRDHGVFPINFEDLEADRSAALRPFPPLSELRLQLEAAERIHSIERTYQ